jgi:hypothetical protein
MTHEYGQYGAGHAEGMRGVLALVKGVLGLDVSQLESDRR